MLKHTHSLSLSLSLNQCCWLGSSGFWGCSERVPSQCWLVLGSSLLLTYLLSSYWSKKGCLPYLKAPSPPNWKL
jgi:hypothetical protein